jgi:hypothetical protein
MNTHEPYTIEELNLITHAVQEVVAKHLAPGTVFFMVLCDGKKCGACATIPPEMAGDIQAAMGELSQRHVQFNN